jgi:hypothetical protein
LYSGTGGIGKDLGSASDPGNVTLAGFSGGDFFLSLFLVEKSALLFIIGTGYDFS